MTLFIGQAVQAKGIYLGLWEPKERKGQSLEERKGQSLGRIFDLYAAPTDLLYGVPTDLKHLALNFLETVDHVAGLQNWHGHDGARFENDTAVYQAIRDERFDELAKWWIPTLDILYGKDVYINGTTPTIRDVQKDHMFAHRETGAFKGTFVPQISGRKYDAWHLSCTEYPGAPDFVWIVDFNNPSWIWQPKDGNEFFCRAVRAELRL